MTHTASMIEGGCLAVTVQNGAQLSQRKASAAYNLAVDHDVHAIGTNSQSVRSQVVYILTTINPEVRAIIGGAGVNRFTDRSNGSAGSSGHSDGGRRESAGRYTVQR